MRRRALFSLVALGLVVGLAPPAQAVVTESKVTGDDAAGSYVLANRRTEATRRWSGAARGTASRTNRPSRSTRPTRDVVVAGSNDYCAAIVNNEVWAGYYRSDRRRARRGRSAWCPGTRTTTSDAGRASPVHGTCGASGDPTQSFDGDGNLFYGFICFNRAKPINGGVYVAKYTDDGATYDRTALVKRGSPSGQFQTGAVPGQDQPHGRPDRRRVRRQRVRRLVAVPRVRTGTTPCCSRGRPTTGSRLDGRSGHAGRARDGVVRRPRGRARRRPSASRTSRTLDRAGRRPTSGCSARPTAASRSERPRTSRRSPVRLRPFTGGTGGVDCGDGPFVCPSGFVFSRFFSNSAVAADEDGAHVVWAVVSRTARTRCGRARSTDGDTWTRRRDDRRASRRDTSGCPDVASADGDDHGRLLRLANAIRATRRTARRATRPTGTNSGDVVQHVDGAVVRRMAERWTRDADHEPAGSNFGWMTHGSRRVGFWGDYLYVSAVPGAVNVVWTDSRDLVSGDRSAGRGRRRGVLASSRTTASTYPNDINAPAYIIADDRRPMPRRRRPRPEHLRRPPVGGVIHVSREGAPAAAGAPSRRLPRFPALRSSRRHASTSMPSHGS